MRPARVGRRGAPTAPGSSRLRRTPRPTPSAPPPALSRAKSRGCRDYGHEAIKRRQEDAALFRRYRAQAHTRAGRHADAVGDYTELLRLEPRNLEAIANRGLAHAQLGEHGKAIADYTEGLRLNPHDEAVLQLRQRPLPPGRLRPRRRRLHRALRLDPRNLWTLGNRGKAYLLWGDPGRAAADFTRLIRLDPGNVKQAVRPGLRPPGPGRHDRALADYTECYGFSRPRGCTTTGLAHARAGHLAKAVADFTERCCCRTTTRRHPPAARPTPA
ncbi:MAG: tetratricopeptide repeat protein [Gemmataceae bacterium]